jgi:DNA-binding FadR family transcriptional regulator
VAEEAIVEHDRILQAIENGLPSDARNAMIDHLEKARDRYRPWASRSEL